MTNRYILAKGDKRHYDLLETLAGYREATHKSSVRNRETNQESLEETNRAGTGTASILASGSSRADRSRDTRKNL